MKISKIIKLLILTAILGMVIVLTQTVFADKSADYIMVDPCVGFESLPGTDTTIYCGVHQRAAYRIEVPASWNGDLLMWAHGYRLDPTYLTVDNPPFREWLVENGYAWAASSYSENGFNVTIGAKDTKALVKWFQEQIAIPGHVYLSGESMGGGVTVTSIEQWPNLYDGAMPTCGAVADYTVFDHLLHYLLASQALAGVEAEFPIPGDFSSTTYPIVKDNLAAAPGLFPFALNSQGEQLKDLTMMLSGGERPVFEQGFLFWYGSLDTFIIDFGVCEIAGVRGVHVENIDTIYQFDGDPALTPDEQWLNDNILRVTSDPQAIHPNGIKNWPVTSGKISIPVVALHTLGDLFVPFSQEQIYAERVAAQGKSDLLVSRAIRDILHCGFVADEYISGFTDLVNWVENGVKPAGDDILTPAVLANPNFGCQFTAEDREPLYGIPFLTIPPCP